MSRGRESRPRRGSTSISSRLTGGATRRGGFSGSRGGGAPGAGRPRGFLEAVSRPELDPPPRPSVVHDGALRQLEPIDSAPIPRVPADEPQQGHGRAGGRIAVLPPP